MAADQGKNYYLCAVWVLIIFSVQRSLVTGSVAKGFKPALNPRVFESLHFGPYSGGSMQVQT